MVKRKIAGLVIMGLIMTVIFVLSQTSAQLDNPNTAWMSGNYGVGFHYLQDKMSETKNGGSTEWNNAVNSFDVNQFASDCAATGAKWVLFTVGQNSGYYCSPNATLDSYSGYKPGDRNTTRDLPMEIANALSAKGIKLMLYLPSNAPKSDSKIANAFGLTTTDSNGNWHVNEAFCQKWTQVIQEWSDRYGSKVSGWWFDGFYSGNGFTADYGKYYSDAAKHGNSKSIIALNRGASSFVKASDYQDYLAGERGTDTLLTTICTGRWITDIQWQAFTPIGGWWTDSIYYTDPQIINYTNDTLTNGGALTWDICVTVDGHVVADQLALFKRIKSSITPSTTPIPTPTPNPGGISSGHTYEITVKSSTKAVVVQSASTSNSAAIIQYTYSSASPTNDEWTLTDLGTGYYKLINANSGKAMVVQSASLSAGALIIQYTYNGSHNDEWKFVNAGGGYYYIVNNLSGLYLDLPGNSTSNGTQFDQAAATGGDTQKFQLTYLR